MNANFGLYLHERSGSGTLADAAGSTCARPVDVAAAAGSLRASGLAAGDLMLLVCSHSINAARAYLGALYGGIIPILLHEQDVARRLPLICARTGARVVWTNSEQASRRIASIFPGLRPVVGLEAAAEIAAPAHRRADDQAVLMPTSGTTGIPRLVCVTHGNLRSNTEAICRSQNLTAGENAMLILPISYCFGASVLHSHLAAGGHLVLDRRFMFPDKVLDAMDHYRCTTFAGVPSVFRTLLKRSRLSLAAPTTIRRLLQAGGRLDHESIVAIRKAVPHADFYVMYGATEATARCTTMPPDRLDDYPGGVGRPLDNLEVRVVAEATGSPLGPGETGEIWFRGPSITPGYYREPEATAAKYWKGWLKTGDLGHLADGYLYIDGRKSEFVKTRGLRIALHEVETLVRGLDGVEDVGACAVADQEHGEAIRLYVVPDGTKNRVSLDELIRTTMPPSWTLATVATVEALPTTASGKLDRSALAP